MGVVGVMCVGLCLLVVGEWEVGNLVVRMGVKDGVNGTWYMVVVGVWNGVVGIAVRAMG